MTFDLTIGIGDVVNSVILLMALVRLYFVVRSQIAGLDKFKTDIVDEVSNVRQEIKALDDKVSKMDDKYVRKDVHDAHIAMIREQLRPLDDIRGFLFSYSPLKRKRK